MKQIIEGKVFNTERAERIDTRCNGLSGSDFNYLWEALYITKRGAFFLHRDGGAASSCSRSCGGGRVGDERIETLTQEEALDWCEQARTDIDTIAKFFTIEEA